MNQRLPKDSVSWVITDADGRIESISSAARELLRLKTSRRVTNLLAVFPAACKALVFDIEVALTGWPTSRTVVLRQAGGYPTAVRYVVSRQFGEQNVRLFWQLSIEKAHDAQHCA